MSGATCLLCGTRFFGKTEEVPGVFHVATKFFHLNFVPLYPKGSCLVIDKPMSPSTRGHVGVAIPLNKKSVGLAWARGLAWVTFVFSTVYTMGTSDGSEPQADDTSGSILQIVMLVSLVLALYLQLRKRTKHASYDRAIELCSHFNSEIRPIIERSVNEHFNKLESGRVPLQTTLEEVDDVFECTNKMHSKVGNINDTDRDIV
ncbi:hypothetical protein CTEN210_13573 [Chaetoceros tenuissimus]|uniref:Uncharacterized protein n=1 Tax=Chaetoceros tenuissimus TaxID=426638 RepID=A0AAD3D406_9STRA|nr:hypothetical protein CTEN210_13573 [Chaetoceros tenuissimus]